MNFNKHALIEEVLKITETTEQSIEKVLNEVVSYNNKSSFVRDNTIGTVSFYEESGVLYAKSSKWKNLELNFKDLIYPFFGNLASFLALIKTDEIALSILAGLGLWGVLVDAKKIRLNQNHAKLLWVIGYSQIKEPNKSKFDLKDVYEKLDLDTLEIDNIIKDLLKLKIIKKDSNLLSGYSIIEKIVVR